MRSLYLAPIFLLLSVSTAPAEPIQALRFEGLWNLDGPGTAKFKLEFQVTGEEFSATFYHPLPSALSNIQIDGDKFTAWYLDEFGSKVNVTAQLKGSELQFVLAPDGRPPLIYSGARTAPERYRAPQRRYSGTFTKSPHGASGEFSTGEHTYVFSGGVEGNCVTASYGKDGKGASVNGCLSVKVKQ